MTIPERPAATDYERPPRETHQYVPDVAAALRDRATESSTKGARRGKS